VLHRFQRAAAITGRHIWCLAVCRLVAFLCAAGTGKAWLAGHLRATALTACALQDKAHHLHAPAAPKGAWRRACLCYGSASCLMQLHVKDVLRHIHCRRWGHLHCFCMWPVRVGGVACSVHHGLFRVHLLALMSISVFAEAWTVAFFLCMEGRGPLSFGASLWFASRMLSCHKHDCYAVVVEVSCHACRRSCMCTCDVNCVPPCLLLMAVVTFKQSQTFIPSMLKYKKHWLVK
jgi:hypothetical protein